MRGDSAQLCAPFACRSPKPRSAGADGGCFEPPLQSSPPRPAQPREELPGEASGGLQAPPRGPPRLIDWSNWPGGGGGVRFRPAQSRDSPSSELPRAPAAASAAGRRNSPATVGANPHPVTLIQAHPYLPMGGTIFDSGYPQRPHVRRELAFPKPGLQALQQPPGAAAGLPAAWVQPQLHHVL